MAHYGPRRPPGSTTRLLSTDISKTIDGVRQTVLDVRCAVAWLATRPEVDADNLGLVGTSLGSLVGAVVAQAEVLVAAGRRGERAGGDRPAVAQGPGGEAGGVGATG